MAILKNAINALDPSPDKTKELTLLLSLLSELCKAQVTNFTKSVQDSLRTAGTSPENKTIPVTEILATHEEYRAYVEADAGKIATEVADAVKQFVSGSATDIIDGVASLVTTGLTAIIGAGDATEQEMRSYYIVVEDFSMARYDICAWSRQIDAQGITNQIQNALAIVAFKSSVDVTKISLNTFLNAYALQLSQMKFPANQQKEYLDFAVSIYNKLRGDTSTAATANGTNGTSLTQAINSKPFEVATFHTPGTFRGSLWRK